MGSQPPHGTVTPDARRRALRRNPVLRYPTRAYQADRASRTRPARRPARPTKRPASAGHSRWTLDKTTAISDVVPEEVVHPGLLGGWVVLKPPVQGGHRMR